LIKTLKQTEFVLLYLFNWVGRGILMMDFAGDGMRYLKDHFEQFRTTRWEQPKFCG